MYLDHASTLRRLHLQPIPWPVTILLRQPSIAPKKELWVGLHLSSNLKAKSPTNPCCRRITVFSQICSTPVKVRPDLTLKNTRPAFFEYYYNTIHMKELQMNTTPWK
jgi:hypothetical protein